jgi:hypothetical protein
VLTPTTVAPAMMAVLFGYNILGLGRLGLRRRAVVGRRLRMVVVVM